MWYQGEEQNPLRPWCMDYPPRDVLVHTTSCLSKQAIFQLMNL